MFLNYLPSHSDALNYQDRIRPRNSDKDRAGTQAGGQAGRQTKSKDQDKKKKKNSRKTKHRERERYYSTTKWGN